MTEELEINTDKIMEECFRLEIFFFFQKARNFEYNESL